LGRATAISLALGGADVALVARSQQELDSAKEEVSKIGCRALTLPVDLASGSETAAAVGRTAEALGGIDVLVNAAGTDAPATVEELDVEGWDRTLAVNLRTPFLLSKAAFPRMREAGGRHHRQHLLGCRKKRLGERLGLLRLQIRPHRIYRGSCRRREGAHGIRAIVLYPGAMATNWGAFSPEERQEESEPKEASPTRVLAPERVADLIAWLAASAPEFVLTEGLVLPIEEGLL
jgi:NAD(P)-dependent dehydrogenase (short-subunit alcohol dehydrogenase family)